MATEKRLLNPAIDSILQTPQRSRTLSSQTSASLLFPQVNPSQSVNSISFLLQSVHPKLPSGILHQNVAYAWLHSACYTDIDEGERESLGFEDVEMHKSYSRPMIFKTFLGNDILFFNMAGVVHS